MDAHRGVRWNDIHMVGLYCHSVDDLAYGKRRFPGQKRSQHAFVCWIEVLDQDERHSSVRGQGAQHLAKSLEPSGGGTDANDGEGHLPRGITFRPVCRRLFPGRHFASTN